jgi:hypothetical protein
VPKNQTAVLQKAGFQILFFPGVNRRGNFSGLGLAFAEWRTEVAEQLKALRADWFLTDEGNAP